MEVVREEVVGVGLRRRYGAWLGVVDPDKLCMCTRLVDAPVVTPVELTAAAMGACCDLNVICAHALFVASIT